jgi:hypothetical protein
LEHFAAAPKSSIDLTYLCGAATSVCLIALCLFCTWVEVQLAALPIVFIRKVFEGAVAQQFALLYGYIERLLCLLLLTNRFRVTTLKIFITARLLSTVIDF